METCKVHCSSVHYYQIINSDRKNRAHILSSTGQVLPIFFRMDIISYTFVLFLGLVDTYKTFHTEALTWQVLNNRSNITAK